MKEENVYKVKKILNLEREIIGVRFVHFKEEYERLQAAEYGLKTTYCNMLKRAMEGRHFKLTGTNFFCEYGAYALGIEKPDIAIASGNSYAVCGLYESHPIARAVTEQMKYLNHEVYGLEIGPLQDMEDADVVIIVAYAEKIMRVLQGYAYKFGMPQNLHTLGNQAACSDLTSKPYYNNDLNISLMCVGARMYMKCEPGEMGAAMPINQFDSVAEGIVMTVNAVASNKEKTELLKRLERKDELGIEIKKDVDYGTYLDEYDDFLRKRER